MTISSLFTGRLGRKHFALTWLAMVGALLALGIVMTVMSSVNDTLGTIFGLFCFIASVVIAIVSLGVAVRRYHDLGWNGWLVLLAFVPFVNIVMALIKLLKVGNAGTNAYGAPTPSDMPLVDAVLNRSAVTAPAVVAEPVTEVHQDTTPPATN